MISLLLAAAFASAPGPSPSPEPSPAPPAFGAVSDFPPALLLRLPTARNAWSVFESQVPGGVTDRIDVGGLRALIPARLGGRGPSWTQNAYVLDGLDLTDPFSGEEPLLLPDLDAAEALRFATAGHPATVAVPGIEVAWSSRRGGEERAGMAQVYYQGGATQGDRVPAAKAERGVVSRERFRHALDAQVGLGGPLGGSARGFASLAARDLSRRPHDVAEAVGSRLLSGLARVTGRLSRYEVGALAAGQGLSHEHDGASGRVPLASTLDSDRRSWAALLDVRGPLGGLWLEGVAGVTGAAVEGRFQPEAVGQSGLELFVGRRSGPAPVAEEGTRRRATARAVLSGQARGWPGTHDFRLGFSVEGGRARRTLDVREGVQREFFEGRPFAVRLFEVPATTRPGWTSLALFAQDRVSLGSAVALDLGARLETASGGLAGQQTAVRWTTLSPRAAVVVAPPGDRLRLRAGWARSTHRLLGRHVEMADPGALGGVRRLWSDSNGDRQYQPGEERGVLQRFGGPVTRVDPGLRAPYTLETMVSAELRVGSVRLSATGIDRRDRDLLETVNEGVTFADYSPVRLPDTGGDGVFGTADDQVLTVFEQARATLGADRFLLTNPPLFRTRYQGVDLAARTDLSARLFVQVSASAFRIEGMASQDAESQEYDPGVVGGLLDDPNTLLEADNRLFFDRAYLIKAAAAWRAGAGFEVGAVAKYYDGLPFGRKLVVAGLNQGPFFVFAAPRGNRATGVNGHRVEYNLTLDLGVQKRFRSGLALHLDLFNALDTTNNTRETDLSSPLFKERLPLEIQAPRVLRLGLSYRF